MEFTVVPLVGPFHLRSPGYNAVTVRETVSAGEPDALLTSALGGEEFGGPRWQDTPEIALPLAVVPWARRKGMPFLAIGEPHPEPGSEEDFRRYIEPYPELRRRLDEVDALLRPVRELLAGPLTLGQIEDSLVPAVRDYQIAREESFEDGPATGWLRRRMESVAERAVREVSGLGARRPALLAPVDHIPFLRPALEAANARLAPTPRVAASPEAKERALLDYAFRVEVPEPARVIAQLRELEGAEARFHEAGLLLAGGHGYEALELLEATSRGDFSAPYFLPGYLLARLGQLRDLAGRREDALRAYRGVLALDYAPAEAIEAAQAGLQRPFEP